jgi:hypothetical protein
MTIAKLTKLNACPEGIQYFKDHKFKTVEQAVTEILKTDHICRFSWSIWLICHSLSKMDSTRYAVYAAEQVIESIGAASAARASWAASDYNKMVEKFIKYGLKLLKRQIINK